MQECALFYEQLLLVLSHFLRKANNIAAYLQTFINAGGVDQCYSIAFTLHGGGENGFIEQLALYLMHTDNTELKEPKRCRWFLKLRLPHYSVSDTGCVMRTLLPFL